MPAEGIVRASARWLDLLGQTDLETSWNLLRSTAKYVDLTQTQYGLGLDWLRRIGAVSAAGEVLMVGPQELFGASLVVDPPSWLRNADDLIGSADDLPSDARQLMNMLGVSDVDAVVAVRQVHGRIDLERRREVGARGEAALVACLNERRPGCARHVALDHDGLGYDVEVDVGGVLHHLEVKSTTSRAALKLFVSRHELEIARIDPRWRLVVLGLDREFRIRCVGRIDKRWLLNSAPTDSPSPSRWESASFKPGPEALCSGLGVGTVDDELLDVGTLDDLTPPDWFIAAQVAEPVQNGGSLDDVGVTGNRGDSI